jgi:hypothetical protein
MVMAENKKELSPKEMKDVKGGEVRRIEPVAKETEAAADIGLPVLDAPRRAILEK